ncbi:pfs domain-containing protein [Colletotrichum sojae]|uniref:Pfs domain-containing protein n=1 Tax=Colletotrichum sojae TaxID=2175907 RepID=A0A8H6JE24_9PEZI|nr:pfs domain-containing protein [Colletotrichum sojae]
MARPQRHDFEIAVVCALDLEYDAATLAFDEVDDDDLGKAPGDTNTYTTGRIGRHNVVMALLPGMGKANAASVTAALRSSYTGLKLALLTGVCGGVPTPDGRTEVVLGDVVISKTVAQYDLGRQYPDRLARKDTVDDNLGRPNQEIRSMLAVLGSEFGKSRLRKRTNVVLGEIRQKAIDEDRETGYDRPAAQDDTLYPSTYLHIHRDRPDCGCTDAGGCDEAIGASCEKLKCDSALAVERDRLLKAGAASGGPRIYVKPVASGDTVIKSGAHRDKIAEENGVWAFEMEGAGVWDQVPCIVVKGVCDYADSHKNKKWQPHAAAAAAAVAKALLDLYIKTDKPGDVRPTSNEPASGVVGTSHRFHNTRSGSQYIHTGTGDQNNNTGGGKQFNAHTINFGDMH